VIGQRECTSLDNGAVPGQAGSADRGVVGVAGDPSTFRSGAWTFGRVTGHLLAAQLSWVRGRPTTFGETRQRSGVKPYAVEIRSARDVVRRV
jgi:hypothetical protein